MTASSSDMAQRPREVCRYKGGVAPNCVVVDAMLGWLARWLRIIGIDTAYGDAPDEELARTSCLLVTRDRALFERRRGPALLLLTEDHVEWLSALIHLLNVKPFVESRCPKCNTVLREAPCSDAEALVGHKIYSNRCWICPNCGSVYWEGSHWRGLRTTVKEALQRDVRCEKTF